MLQQVSQYSLVKEDRELYPASMLNGMIVLSSSESFNLAPDVPVLGVLYKAKNSQMFARSEKAMSNVKIQEDAPVAENSNTLTCR